jgi:cell division protein FtsZ
MTINLKMPEEAVELKPRITVFGVGGGGGNAVNNMINSGLDGVEFVVANTDVQALAKSAAERRIQMGTAITEGLGAGSHPEIGAKAAEEAMPEIIDHLSGAHMVFITAGMGGGTGTGAAPVIARAAREQGILTVGVVTKPFQFEGGRRMRTAEDGIDELQKNVDTLIVIPNQNLFRVVDERTGLADAFAMADEVLHSGVASITDLMIKEGLINLDFADVRSVMSGMGKAMMGTGEASGDKRAIEAAEAAISNPLLDDVSIRGAKGVLISISGDPTLFEVDEAATRIRSEIDNDANIILGATFDSSLEGVFRVSVVATGIGMEEAGANAAPEVVTLGELPKIPEALTRAETPAAPEEEDRDIRPAAAKLAQAEHTLFDGLQDDEDEESTGADNVTIRKISPTEPVAHPARASFLSPTEETVIDPAEPFIPAAAMDVEPLVPRMPQIDDFPIPAQREIQARDGKADDMGMASEHKRSGIFDRLASIGLGRKDRVRPAEEPAEEAAPRTEPGFHARRKPSPLMYREDAAEETAEEEHLEIPAFLRRNTN